MRRYTIEVNGKTYLLDVRELSADSFEVTCDDRQFDVMLVDGMDLPEAGASPAAGGAAGERAVPVARPAAPKPAAAPRPQAAKPAASQGAGDVGSLTAPMPGVILSVDVKVGARVKRGDVLCKLEAMKMVNPLRAPKDTVVSEIAVSEGQTVAYGDVLVLFGE
ncbi:MAG TPA: biotin/lipoyl-binding protein [Holophaga sp.]|nr:biotin/lipoyl-binding protein [Holophaga sp.]